MFHANATLYRQSGRTEVFGLTYRSDATLDRWRRQGQRVLVGVKAGERSIGTYADRAGLNVTFLAHRPSLELFAATPR